MAEKLSLVILSERFCIIRFNSSDEVPNWKNRSSWYSITKTLDELSIVCEEAVVPAEVKGDFGWRCIKVLGPLEFGQVGILAGLSKVLAEKHISIFVVSTYDTDYILLKEASLNPAIEVLRMNGYNI
ncbi:MAG: ACT domain-containing protein [Firmicutes bacterium HGW-Firmicutes-7]|nr:MAG: ACT domain-containing protein [Firmicutes bacterium HGW-Firmicutes-7]